MAACAFGVAKLSRWSWWLSLCLLVAGSCATYFLLTNLDPMAPYDGVQMEESQREMIEQMNASGIYSMIPAVVMWVILLGYLIAIKRHFRSQLAQP